MLRFTLSLVFLIPISLGAGSVHAQTNWGVVKGVVNDAESGLPLEGAEVIVAGTNFGTATQSDGRFTLPLPRGSYTLTVQSLGFATQEIQVTATRAGGDPLSVSMSPSTLRLEEITIEDTGPGGGAGVFRIDPATVESTPAPFRDVLRSLKVLPGVATNNELSNQYSVRGGGYNENLIFVEGFEVFLPFRPRQGEQEGLSLLNPSLADQITFFTGGFPARHGGKLSSALEVSYWKPFDSPLAGSAYASLLDAGMHLGGAVLDDRLAITGGLRKARASRFFSTQELKGNYEPDYTDGQLFLVYRHSPSVNVEVLAMGAEHEFVLNPNSRKTFFGTISQDSRLSPSDLKSVWTTFDEGNEERDGYTTGFVGSRLTVDVTPTVRADHDVSVFVTEERERFDLNGSTLLFQVDPGSPDPQGGEGLVALGAAREQNFAHNDVRVQTITGQSRWQMSLDKHLVEIGVTGRALHFSDMLDEKAVVDGLSQQGDPIRIVEDSLQDSAEQDAGQFALYLQDDVRLGESNQVSLSFGARADYYSFSDELTFSPRFAIEFAASDLTRLFGSLGVYHQSPTYRELRGAPEPGETIAESLNRNLKSQRSVQLVAGLERFLTSRRLHLRGEAFYKYITNGISYDIQNIRVSYSGENDVDARTYGLDVQLRGEFVPGMESWVNYSFLVSRERFVDGSEDGKWVPRPTDQRHTISMLIQDYIPGDESWRLHMRTLFGSGLPYTPPIPGDRIGSVVTQAPGDRHSARFPRYFRFDMGATKSIDVTNVREGSPLRLELTGELLNVFNMQNTVAYSWVPDASGIWNRVPTRLTPRTINVRARVVF